LIPSGYAGLLSSKDSSYNKTFSNLDTELRAQDVLLQSDNRFHVVDLAVKKEILKDFGFEGRLPTTSFDLVWTEHPFDQLTVENLTEHLDSLVLIEMKATKNKHGKVRDESLRGFFFGATENEFNIARRLGNRYRFAFVVLSENNDYGKPFHVLLTLDELESRIRTKRKQYQINL
jgi:hypothetical protein